MRVVLVDDSEELRASIGNALSELSGVTLVGSFSRPSAALAAVQQGLRFDAALIDLGLPEMPGERLMAELRRRCPGAPLIALTVRADDAALFGALRGGASGYLLKDASIEELHDALDLAARGGAPMTPSIGRRVLGSFHTGQAPRAAFGLSAREADVLDVLESGASYRDVGVALGIRESTVQTHIKSLYEKLGVHSKAEAVRVSFELRTPGAKLHGSSGFKGAPPKRGQ